MLTKKHFNMIAAALRQARQHTNPDEHNTIDVVADKLAEQFAKDNPRFDELQFLEACK